MVVVAGERRLRQEGRVSEGQRVEEHPLVTVFDSY